MRINKLPLALTAALALAACTDDAPGKQPDMAQQGREKIAETMGKVGTPEGITGEERLNDERWKFPYDAELDRQTGRVKLEFYPFDRSEAELSESRANTSAAERSAYDMLDAIENFKGSWQMSGWECHEYTEHPLIGQPVPAGFEIDGSVQESIATVVSCMSNGGGPYEMHVDENAKIIGGVID